MSFCLVSSTITAVTVKKTHSLTHLPGQAGKISNYLGNMRRCLAAKAKYSLRGAWQPKTQQPEVRCQMNDRHSVDVQPPSGQNIFFSVFCDLSEVLRYKVFKVSGVEVVFCFFKKALLFYKLIIRFPPLLINTLMFKIIIVIKKKKSNTFNATKV